MQEGTPLPQKVPPHVGFHVAELMDEINRQLAPFASEEERTALQQKAQAFRAVVAPSESAPRVSDTVRELPDADLARFAADVREKARQLNEIHEQVLRTLEQVKWCLLVGAANEVPDIVDFAFALLLFRLNEESQEEKSTDTVGALAIALFDDRLYGKALRGGWRNQVAVRLASYADLCLNAGGDYLLTYFDDYVPVLQKQAPLFYHRVKTGKWKDDDGHTADNISKMAAEVRRFLTSGLLLPGVPEPELVETQEAYDALDALRRAQFDEATQKLFGSYGEQARRWLEEAAKRYKAARELPLITAFDDQSLPTYALVQALLDYPEVRSDAVRQSELRSHIFESHGAKTHSRLWAGRLALEVAQVTHNLASAGAVAGLDRLSNLHGSFKSKCPAFDACVARMAQQESPTAEMLDAAWKEITRMLLTPRTLRDAVATQRAPHQSGKLWHPDMGGGDMKREFEEARKKLEEVRQRIEQEERRFDAIVRARSVEEKRSVDQPVTTYAPVEVAAALAAKDVFEERDAQQKQAEVTLGAAEGVPAGANPVTTDHWLLKAVEKWLPVTPVATCAESATELLDSGLEALRRVSNVLDDAGVARLLLGHLQTSPDAQYVPFAAESRRAIATHLRNAAAEPVIDLLLAYVYAVVSKEDAPYPRVRLVLCNLETVSATLAKAFATLVRPAECLAENTGRRFLASYADPARDVSGTYSYLGRQLGYLDVCRQIQTELLQHLNS